MKMLGNGPVPMGPGAGWGGGGGGGRNGGRDEYRCADQRDAPDEGDSQEELSPISCLAWLRGLVKSRYKMHDNLGPLIPVPHAGLSARLIRITRNVQPNKENAPESS